jgi:hypothetical protein
MCLSKNKKKVFISEITARAFIIADSNKRRTLSRSDIAKALSKSDQFDFLIDIVPREELPLPTASTTTTMTTTTTTSNGAGKKTTRQASNSPKFVSLPLYSPYSTRTRKSEFYAVGRGWESRVRFWRI